MNAADAAINSDELVALLTQLIAARSVNPPGDEVLAAQVLKSYLESCGLEADFAQRDGDRTNLICKLPGRATAGKSLLLTSHLDVVPVDDGPSWRSDPFDAVIESGRIVGRGACDAKGQLAAMACAVTSLARGHVQLEGDLIFLAVFGEEKRGLGSKAAVADGLGADAAVIGEPTGNRVCIGHPGRLGATLSIDLAASHPTQADSRHNSILVIGNLLSFLSRRASDIERRAGGDFEAGKLVPFRIQGGRQDVLSPPHRTQTTMSLWFGHPLSHDDVISLLDVELAAFTKTTGIAVQTSYHRGAMAAGVDRNEAIVQHATQAARQAGMNSQPAIFGASCDMYVFCQQGIASIILGPGSLDQCHAANESIGIDELCTACEIYQRLAVRFLR